VPAQGYWGATKPPAGIALDRAHRLARGLVGCWPIYGGPGQVVDLIGGNHLAAAAAAPTSDIGKHGGAALHFTSASNQFASRASNPMLEMGDISFTWSVWTWFDSLTSYRMLIAKDSNATPGRDMALFFDGLPPNHFVFNVFKPTDVGVTVESLVSPVVGRWYHVLAWHDADADTANIQVDGGTVVTVATGGSLQAPSAAPLYLGGDSKFPTSLMLDGKLSNIMFWKRVLPPGERDQLYAQPYAMFAAPVWRRYFLPPIPPVIVTPGAVALSTAAPAALPVIQARPSVPGLTAAPLAPTPTLLALPSAPGLAVSPLSATPVLQAMPSAVVLGLLALANGLSVKALPGLVPLLLQLPAPTVVGANVNSAPAARAVVSNRPGTVATPTDRSY
jgi:hypothetical protein